MLLEPPLSWDPEDVVVCPDEKYQHDGQRRRDATHLYGLFLRLDF